MESRSTVARRLLVSGPFELYEALVSSFLQTQILRRR